MSTPVTDNPRQDSAQSWPDFERLRATIQEQEQSRNAIALAVALHDEETGLTFEHEADRWFHAASTIKVAILVGVFSAIRRGAIKPYDRLHIRNRFHSAIDGTPFRVRSDRDANAAVQAMTGKTMRISELALHMIATSSNLATNLLLDLVGLPEIHSALERMCITGVDVVRGVEDERAWNAELNNRVTARGLVQLLREISEGETFSPELSQQMMDLLHAQEFKSGIPAHLPREVRVAHKTGDISTIAHDAGIVFVPNRKPYVLAILTEWPPDGKGRSATIATISKAVFEILTGGSANGRTGK